MTTGSKAFRRAIKTWYKLEHGGICRSTRPLTEEARYYSGEEDWESYTEYGFLRGTDYTDAELEEIREDMWLRVTSPYDCSGQRFTRWITFHRNPCGLISYTHRIGIDV